MFLNLPSLFNGIWTKVVQCPMADETLIMNKERQRTLRRGKRLGSVRLSRI
jgi:hypothetical protein